ncbi:hypothetical protein [Massilia niabensis]|uniref:ATP-dependent DNA ligase family profile domain-containing protein n=1 Tax=Massilia niabensis TaxID=544910 RepID=A0ABW0L1G2_9BURK
MRSEFLAQECRRSPWRFKAYYSVWHRSGRVCYSRFARVDAGDVRIFSRSGLDWTSKLTRLQDDIAGSGLPNGWYDGEIAVLDANGRPDFGLL